MEKVGNFNAGAILSGEEVRQLTESGCDTHTHIYIYIYPIQRIEVGKNAPQRRNNDLSTLPPKYKSRLVKTTEGPRADSPAAGVDSQNIECSWCAQAHSSYL